MQKSWVDLSSSPVIPPTPDRVTPPLCGIQPDEYLRLLREAQRDSNASSGLMSLASTRKNSPHSSPKSPPNSPNNETVIETEEMRDIYVNYPFDTNRTMLGPCDKDWVWDWSSRPDQEPPKDWKFKHPRKRTYSIRGAKVGQIGLFSREVVYTVAITNILSLIIGTGIGIWFSKRSSNIMTPCV